MAPRDPNNIIQGVGWSYWAPIGTAEPADNTMHIAPPSPWVDLGFTDGGVSITEEMDFEMIEVDQIPDEVGARQTGRRITLATAFAEPTLDTWHKMVNTRATLAAVAAGGAGTAAGQSLTPGNINIGAPTYCMLIFDGFAPGGFARRIIMRRVLNTDNIEIGYSKTDKSLITVSLRGFYVSNSVAPHKIIDQTAVGS